MKEERDPNGLDQHAPGAKLDEGKILAGILPEQFPHALLEIINFKEDIKNYGHPDWLLTFLCYEKKDELRSICRTTFCALIQCEAFHGPNILIPKMGLLSMFPKALYGVLEVATYGARKYSRGGWQYVEDGFERYTDALIRHLLKIPLEDRDPESGLYHFDHMAWNALARFELYLRKDFSE